MSAEEVRAIYKRIAAERRAARKAKKLNSEERAGTSDVTPPAEPLSPLNSAVRFAVVSGKVDVRPTEAWKGHERSANAYRRNALQLAERLHQRLEGSNSAPDVLGSVAALLRILGNSIDRVHPDQLRMAARAISAKAKSYGHPQAMWELSADAVSLLFELESSLVDLQGFVKSTVVANEAEIRALDLTSEQAAHVKEVVDELTSAIAGDDAFLTNNARSVFEAALIASETARDPGAVTSIEASRLLVFENLTRTLAAAIADGRNAERRTPARGRNGDQQVKIASLADDSEKGGSLGRRASTQRLKIVHSSDVGADLGAWSGFVARVLVRLERKAPERIADAVLDAITSTIRHAPKTILALSAAVAAVIWSGPAVLTTSALSVAASWIGYEVWKRKGRQK